MALTSLEKECLDLLEDVSMFLTTKPKGIEFMEMMGRIRDTRYRLRNKAFGCPTGQHSSSQSCKH